MGTSYEVCGVFQIVSRLRVSFFGLEYISLDCREIQKKRIALIVSIQLTLNPFCIAESPAYRAKRGAQTHPSDETARPWYDILLLLPG